MRSKIRVAVVIPRYAPVFGGAENQCRSLNRSLLASGAVEIPFLLTCRPGSAIARNECIDEVEVKRLGFPGLGRLCRYSFHLMTLFYLLLRAGRFDIIHCHATDILGFIATLVGKITGKPVMLKLSSSGEFQHGFGYGKLRATRLGAVFGRIRARVMRFTATNAHIVALNRKGFHELQQVGATRPVIMPNGVDRNAYFPATEPDRLRLRAQHGFGESDVILLFTGRFVHLKGIDLLLAAFGSILEKKSREGVGLRLCLVGSGDMQEDSVHQQIDRIAKLYPEHIKLLPQKNPVTDYLQMADAFVFPSRSEGMPNSVLEALAAGLPCILSDIEPHREIAEFEPSAPIHFFASGDSRSLESQLVEVAARLNEERRRGARTIACLNERYDINIVSGRYVELYRQALGLI